MAEPVRLIVVSDSDEYSARVLRELEAKGIPAAAERVASGEAMRAALARGPWDAAVSDLGLPGVGIEEVVRLARDEGPDLPVIVVSARAARDDADRALRAGAAEFIPMEKLPCAACAVERVVREAAVRRERVASARELKDAHDLLDSVLSGAPVLLLATDARGVITLYAGDGTRVAGREPGELVGQNVFEFYAARPGLMEDFRRALAGEEFRDRITTLNGSLFEGRFAPVRDERGGVAGAVVVASDVTERIHVQEMLEEMNRHLRSIISNAPVVLLATDAEGTVTLFEGRGTELFGPEYRDIVGMNVFRDIAARCPGFAEKMSEALAGSEVSQVVTTETGVHVSSRCVPVRDGEGNVTGAVCVGTDVTDRVRAEEALRQSEARYRALVENTNDMVVTTDPGGTITYASPQVERFGFPAAEVVSRSIFDFVVEEDRERVAADLRRTLETGEEFPTEFRVRRPDGHVLWLEEVGKVQRDETGRITGLVSVLRDVTDRRRSQEALRASEEKYRRLFESESDAIILFDAETRRIEDANPAALLLFGYSREEMAALVLDDVWAEREAGASALARALASDVGTIRDPERLFRRKDGTVFPGEVMLGVFESHGRRMVIKAVRDITERKRAEEELRRARDELERRVEERTAELKATNADLTREIEERTRAEAALRESEERYRSFVQDFQGIAYRGRMDWTPVFFHGTVEEITGYTEEEFVSGHPRWNEVVHPDDFAVLVERDAGIWTVPGFSVDREYRILRKDGEVRWVRELIQNVCDESGVPAHVEGTIRDVTARKLAEARLREQMDFLTNVLESLTHPFYVVDAATRRIALANSAAHLGPLTDASTCHGLTHGSAEPCREPEHCCPLDEVKRTGAPVTVEHVHLDAEGNERIVEVHAYPIKDDRGNVVQMIEYNIDITERRRAEEEVRSLARFPSENPNPVMRIDRDGTIVYANAASAVVLEEWQTEAGGRAPDRWRDAVAEAIVTGEQRTLDLDCCDRVFMVVVAPVAEAGYANVYASDVTERRHAEDELRESEERFRRFFESAPDAMFVFDADGTCLAVNNAAERELGREPGSTVGKRQADIFPEEIAARNMEQIRHVMRTGEAAAFAGVPLTLAKGLRYLDATFAPMRDDEGKVVSAMGVARDVTDVKLATDALRQSEDRYALAQRAAGIGSWDWDVQADVIHWSPEMESVSGFAPSGPIGGYEAFLASVHPDDREQVEKAIRDCLERRSDEYSVEHRILRPDGQTRWLYSRGSIIADDRGEPARLIGVAMDVTERERAARALRESESRLNAFLTHFQGIAYQVDVATYRPFFFRGKVEEITGYKAEEIVDGGVSWDRLVHPEDLALVERAAERLRAEPGRVEDNVYRIRTRGGNVRWVRDIAVSVCEEEPERRVVNGSVYDVTERHLAAEALREAHDSLERRVEERTAELASANARLELEIEERRSAEEAVRESEARYRALATAENPVIWSTDVEARMVEPQPGWEALTGQTWEEYRDYGYRRMFHPDDVAAMLANIGPSTQAGRILPLEIRIFSKAHGGYRYFRTTGAIVPGEDGAAREWVGMHVDVDERRLAEEALAEAERRLRDFVEETDLLVTQVDSGGRFVYVNRTSERIFGCPPERCVGQLAFDFVHPDDREATEAAFAGWIRDRVRSASLENRQVSPAGEVHHVLWTVNPRYDEGGNVTTIWSVARDITDRKLAEEELRRQKETLQTVVDNIPVMLTFYDASGRFQLVNREFERAVGWTAEEAQEIDLLAACYPDPELRRQAWEYMAEALPGWRDFTVTTKGGRTVESSWANVRLSDGTQIGIGIDVSERKRAEEEIRASEERYRALFENESDAIVLVDAETRRIEDANPAALKLFGYTREAFMDVLVDSISAEKEETRDSLKRVLAVEPDTVRIPRRLLLRRNGATFPAEVCWSTLRSGGGRKIIAAIRDITEWEESQEKLRRSEEMYRSLVRSIPDAVTVAGPDGVIRYASSLRAELHGYESADQLLGMRSADLVTAGGRERFRATFHVALRGQAPPIEEFVFLRSDGSEFAGEMTFGVVGAGLGKPDSVVMVVRDVTGRRELERRLMESQRLEAVGRLAGGLAHDFNNLLTAIGGFSNRILRKLRPESPLRADAAQIKKASDMASSLTNQLLAFSRRQMMQPAVLTLNEVLSDVEMMLRRLIGEDIELVIMPAPSPGLAMADPGQIGQVIVNLAVNARDAMPHGGVLTIETADIEFGGDRAVEHPGVPPGEYVTVAVSDTGAGIRPDVLPHIFEPFFTTKDQGKGTGLGLSTVYGIVTQSGGHVRVRSEVGKGSTFTVYLPRIGRGHEEEPPPERPEARDSLRGDETVLLVEDEEVVKDLARLTLADYGYRVLAASNGEEALAIAARHEGPIHLLLADVVMPQMGGREVAERVVASRPGTKVIFMSGYTENIAVRRVGEGEAPLIAKPFGEEDLVRLVRKVLGPARERPAAN